MAEKDFVVGNGNLDSQVSEMILNTIAMCASKNVMPLNSNISELLVKHPKMFKDMQSEIAKGKVFLKSGSTMETLVIGGESSKLPKDAVGEFYTTLQSKVAKLPDAENAPGALEFIDSALKQCEAFRVTGVVADLNVLKSRLLSTVMSTTSAENSTELGLELDAVPSAN